MMRAQFANNPRWLWEAGVLGLTDSEFEAAFQSYVRQRYLF